MLKGMGRECAMSDNEKAVLRLNDGRMLKGSLQTFSPDGNEVIFKAEKDNGSYPIKIDDVKAVFFVRSFEGNCTYREKKTFGISKQKGHRVFIKFKDGESMVGYLDGEVPWEKGFFLSRQDQGRKGFFVLPVDENSNNTKVFVVSSSVVDVTVVP